MTALVVSAPAKVNLYLAVGAKRADGYHELVTVMQSLALADEVLLRPAEELRVACEPDPCAIPTANLAYRAAVEFSRAFGVEPRVDITVHKRVPAGAGLGGGSADAAAVLLGMSRLFGVPEDPSRLTDVARSLGSDVPFALTGGTALLDGRGDRLVRTIETRALDLALVNPGPPVSTAEAYAAFDRMPGAESPSPDALLEALARGDSRAVAGSLHNNMTAASLGLVPEIGDALAFVREAPGVLGAEMAGSGSTVFGVCADAASAEACAIEARDRGWWAEATSTSPTGARVISSRAVNEGAGSR